MLRGEMSTCQQLYIAKLGPPRCGARWWPKGGDENCVSCVLQARYGAWAGPWRPHPCVFDQQSAEKLIAVRATYARFDEWQRLAVVLNVRRSL